MPFNALRDDVWDGNTRFCMCRHCVSQVYAAFRTHTHTHGSTKWQMRSIPSAWTQMTFDLKCIYCITCVLMCRMVWCPLVRECLPHSSGYFIHSSSLIYWSFGDSKQIANARRWRPLACVREPPPVLITMKWQKAKSKPSSASSASSTAAAVQNVNSLFKYTYYLNVSTRKMQWLSVMHRVRSHSWFFRPIFVCKYFLESRKLLNEFEWVSQRLRGTLIETDGANRYTHQIDHEASGRAKNWTNKSCWRSLCTRS